MNFLFRADASLRIGTGHVMRCLTLATELRRRGMDCRFACRPMEGDIFRRIREEGFDILALPDVKGTGNLEGDAPWLEIPWQTDAEQTIHAMEGFRPDWLVVDHYGLDARWEKALRPHCGRIMAIDDTADRSHDIDLLLDQNLVADLDTRYQGLLPAKVVTLLGPRYALLQEAYAKLHSQTPPRLGPVRRVLVFFGGVDEYNLTGMTIRAFLALDRIDVLLDVVINTSGPGFDAVKEISSLHSNITIHGLLPSLAPLMQKADLCIGAGGSTTWERCCMGLYTLVVTVASNQQPVAWVLDSKCVIHWIARVEDVTEGLIRDALANAFVETGLSEKSELCRGLVDGKGTARVCDRILES
jgi:UDP-2,4-diacetamido-2,4,6-trideoxy-beta-L-altropyranose hydrolase